MLWGCAVGIGDLVVLDLWSCFCRRFLIWDTRAWGQSGIERDGDGDGVGTRQTHLI